jgi:hypothetical protein
VPLTKREPTENQPCALTTLFSEGGPREAVKGGRSVSWG